MTTSSIDPIFLPSSANGRTAGSIGQLSREVGWLRKRGVGGGGGGGAGGSGPFALGGILGGTTAAATSNTATTPQWLGLGVGMAGAANTLKISSAAAAGNAILSLHDAGTEQWRLWKQGSNALAVYDTANSRSFLTFFPASATIQPSVRMNFFQAAPDIDLFGGQFGDGSNVCLSVGSGNLQHRYAQATTDSHRVTMDLTALASDAGNNGVRRQRAGTITSVTGTAVVGSGTDFNAGTDVGHQFVVVEYHTSGWRRYHFGTVASVTDTTHMTLTGSMTGGDVPLSPAPTSALWAIDPGSISSDYAVGGWGSSYGTFYGGLEGSVVMNTGGSMNVFSFSAVINDAAAGGSDQYGEVAVYNAHQTGNRLGALVSNEFANHILSAKQSRSSVVSAFTEDENTYASYNGVAFGTGSNWKRTGARTVWIGNVGNIMGGTGLYISGQSPTNPAFARPIVVNNGGMSVGSEGTDIFTVDQNGSVAVKAASFIGPGSAYYSTGFPAALLLPDGTTAASGMQFGVSAGYIAAYQTAANEMVLSAANNAATTRFRFVSAASQVLAITLNDGGTDKWSLRKDTTNVFSLRDNVNTKDVFIATAGSAPTIAFTPDAGAATFGGTVRPGTMTTTTRNALTPANGMVIYNTTTGDFEGYKAGAWVSMTSGTGATGLTSAASGTLTPTGGADTLTTQTTASRYVLALDLSGMANGDVVEVRLKTKVLSGGTSHEAYLGTFSNVQAQPQKYSNVVYADIECVAIVTRTAGSVSSIPWSLLAF